MSVPPGILFNCRSCSLDADTLVLYHVIDPMDAHCACGVLVVLVC